MASYLVTGSTRGIGFQVVTFLASKPTSEVSKIFAAARKENEALKKLIESSSGRVQFVPLEVTSQESVKAAVSTVEVAINGKGLDVLINNAGIANFGPQKYEEMTDLNEHFNINVVGTHNVISAFLPLLKQGTSKKVINITSTMGSMAMSAFFKHQPTPAYKVSKAALNMLTVQYSEALEGEGFTVVALCPGWVKTDLGTDAADLTVEESANGILEIAERITTKDNGKYFTVRVPGWEDKPQQYHGGERPW
ncbi:hypothetical protein C1H76_6724 [Elsinoe australis]|uniref:Uncharacterized protein n=1 Tax=Elsinoe australis TaxID=40998 RepID=A0A4U7ASA1_9PEZI|nr:hypothetical protein C1H76_6724 [Elsinoe australis]